jgi:hypothetical protein
MSVGRRRFTELFGYRPAQLGDHHADFDYTAIDTVFPHPVYAKQGWVSILNPGERTADQARALISESHGRAVARHRPRGSTAPG